MVKKSFSGDICSLAQALDVIGEWWSMLIVRDFFLGAGVRRFEQLRDSLGISRNILTERLRTLTDAGVIERVPVKEGGRRQAYQLTEKGIDLLPTLIAMMQWGDRWRSDSGQKFVSVLAREDHQPIAPLQAHSQAGKPLSIDDMCMTVHIKGEDRLIEEWPISALQKAKVG